MRLFGHPVHVMLVHFPIALWPAHFALHLFDGRLPPGVAAVAGFWALAAGTLLGWLALAAGAADLIGLADETDPKPFRLGLVHAALNGTVLIAFTLVAAMEYARYPAIAHGAGFLWVEAALLAAMFTGNYFGGAMVWRTEPRKA